MKRDHPNLRQEPFSSPVGATSSSTTAGGGGTFSMSMTNGKSKLWEETEQDDELLAVLGYKVKPSDMAEVAQKLEQLEEVMGHVQEDGLSHLASETVHYNPSDLSSWLESMISEFNSDPFSDSSITTANNNNNFEGENHQCLFYNKNSGGGGIYDDSLLDYDLKAIPGKAVIYPQTQQSQPPNKKLKPTTESSSSNSVVGIWGCHQNQSKAYSLTESARPVILVDSQENGIRLVHTLMACAEAVQENKVNLAETLVKNIRLLAVAQTGAMKKVAMYFAGALERRIYKLYPETLIQDSSLSDLLQMHFYETCPYLKFAHFTANQAILEAFANKTRVHVIDFSMKQGMQWPALMQALALRPGGPPSFRLTGIGPNSNDKSDNLHGVGWKLAQLAETIHVEFEFEYKGYANSLADLETSMFNVREGEVLAVNSVFELHQLLARPGGIEKLLGVVKELKPVILTVVEEEANHNGTVFLDRFTESLHYYSTLFDSLEGGGGGISVVSVSNEDKLMSEVYLGRQICNVVACEGVDRVERHETLAKWRNRFNSAGFEPVHLGSNAFKQASMLLALFNGGDGYRVEENTGTLTLGWHARPLIATSAWKLS